MGSTVPSLCFRTVEIDVKHQRKILILAAPLFAYLSKASLVSERNVFLIGCASDASHLSVMCLPYTARAW